MIKNSNRILKKVWNSNDDVFLFEEHCLGTHFSANSIVEEEDVRKTFWKINYNDVVIDAGATYGSYTLPALAAGASVYAFEINKWIAKSLRNNISLNNFDKGVVIEKALWNKTGENIDYYTDNLSLYLFGPLKDNTVSEKVETITIDDYFIPLDLPKINWLKIDVDGAEINVLEGAVKILTRYKPRILIELHPIVDGQLPNKAREFFIRHFGNAAVTGPFPYITNKGETSHVLVSLP